MVEPVIVLVEDDAVISELIEFNLKNEGYAVQCYRSGDQLLADIDLKNDIEVSLFILDIMLPGIDGFELCRRLRKLENYELTPVLMLTARGAESDKVKGLENGADDYLTKPFGMREFMARVSALIRRYKQIIDLQANNETYRDAKTVVSSERKLSETSNGTQTIRPGMISSHNITIDDIRHRVYKDQDEIEMTHREYELLKFLMIHKGVAYSRDDLLNYVWGYEYSGETRTVDVHIRQLRRKLEQDDARPIMIETVRGRGYRFSDKLTD
ncbi:MAG: response regulator transcription factor [Clostridiaceae bacterium]|nr:response regulator transcription factor [Clostridiaceae bacterium]